MLLPPRWVDSAVLGACAFRGLWVTARRLKELGAAASKPGRPGKPGRYHVISRDITCA